MPICVISGREHGVQNQLNTFLALSKNARIISYNTIFCDALDDYWVEHSVLVEFLE